MYRTYISRGFLLLLVLLAVPGYTDGAGSAVKDERPGSDVEAPATRELERDLWYAVELLGQRSGYFHIEIRWVPFGGAEALRTREVLRNEMARTNGGVTEEVRVSSTTTRFEAPDGRTLRIENDLDQGGGPTRSRVEILGDRARVTLNGAAGERSFEIPWDESFMGPGAAQEAIDELIGGETDTVTYKVFSFEAGNRILDMKARVVERRPGGGVVLEQEFGGLGAVARETYDRDGTLLRQEVGPVVLRLTGREEALAPIEASLEAFRRITVSLDRRVPHHISQGAFRLMPRPGGEDLSLKQLFVEDGRQSVARDEEGREILLVRSLSEPWPEPATPFDPQPFLQASSLIESDDPQIRRLARSLVTDGVDPLAHARRLERWVFDQIGFSGAGIGLASARQTLDSKDGDCTENAFLLAALLRAVNIPSRVVVGLVGAGEDEGHTRFVPHAWVEAYIGGWLSLDAAVYAPQVDVTHLAMAKTNGAEEGALLDVTVPLLKGLGRFDLAWAGGIPKK